MSDLLADAEAELYAADPESFTARRAELAASAREAGEPAAAKQIAALRKPTRSAWVVNRLVRSDPEVRSRLDAVAADLREAAGGDRLRELTGARSRLVDELTRKALQDLPAPPAALREEVTATLDAAIADPGVAGGWAAWPAPSSTPASASRARAPSRTAPPPRPRPGRPGSRLRPRPSARTAARKRSKRPNGPWPMPTVTWNLPRRPNAAWRILPAAWKPNSPAPASAWPTPGGSPTGPSPGGSGPRSNSAG